MDLQFGGTLQNLKSFCLLKFYGKRKINTLREVHKKLRFLRVCSCKSRQICSAGNRTRVSWLPDRCLTTRQFSRIAQFSRFSRIGRTFIKWQALRRITHFLQLGSRHSAQVDQRFTVNFPPKYELIVYRMSREIITTNFLINLWITNLFPSEGDSQ